MNGAKSGFSFPLTGIVPFPILATQESVLKAGTMQPYVKSRSQKAGLPPGALVHVGERFREQTKIVIIDYDEGHFLEKEVHTVEECLPFKDKQSTTWINISGIHDVDILEELGCAFGLHHLILEDILNTDQRPKMEDCGDYIYIVLKMIINKKNIGTDASEQISIVLGRNFVISFNENESDALKSVRDRIEGGKGKIRKMGPDYLAHAIIDTIIDNYFLALEKTGERIEDIEAELLKNPTYATLHAIQRLKKEMILLRKSVWPLRETISGLERIESPLIQETTGMYFKDIYDHTIQVIDTIETFREMLSGMLDIYLSSVSNKMNQIMKVLTIIATIFMPLTFLAGIYGMNFEYMPELKWRYGYFIILIIMLSIGLAMVIYFRKKKWI